MSKERSMILKMLARGKITPEEAVKLMNALGEAPELDETTDQISIGESAPIETGSSEELASSEEPGSAGTDDWRQDPEFDAQTNRFRRGQKHWFHLRPRFPDPSYAAAIKRFGVDFNSEQLIDLEMAEVTPAEVEDLLTVRRQEWSTENLTHMLVHRVTRQMILQLHELGMGDLPPENLVEFSVHRVTPDMVRRAREAGFRDIGPETLVQFAIHRIDFEAIKAAQTLGPLDEDDAVAMSIHGVTASFINGMKETYPGIRINQLIDMRIHHVSPRYIAELRELELRELTPNRLVEMKIHGVGPEDARRFKELLGNKVSTGQLIEFSIHHVTPEYLEGMMGLHLKDFSPDQLVAMRIHGVSVEAAQKAKLQYGDSLGTHDLVDMAIFGRLPYPD